MQPEARKYLHDIQDACRKLSAFTNGRSLADYLADEYFQSAVERQFEIVGEALARLHKLDATLAESIPDFRRIISFRGLRRIVWVIFDHFRGSATCTSVS
jgi:uncharacterized protein with HEPN domain